MTIRFLADENFDHKTLAGLKRRVPDLDIVAVQEVGLWMAGRPATRDHRRARRHGLVGNNFGDLIWP